MLTQILRDKKSIQYTRELLLLSYCFCCFSTMQFFNFLVFFLLLQLSLSTRLPYQSFLQVERILSFLSMFCLVFVVFSFFIFIFVHFSIGQTICVSEYFQTLFFRHNFCLTKLFTRQYFVTLHKFHRFCKKNYCLVMWWYRIQENKKILTVFFYINITNVIFL